MTLMTTCHEQRPDFFFEEIAAVPERRLRPGHGRSNGHKHDQANRTGSRKLKWHGESLRREANELLLSYPLITRFQKKEGMRRRGIEKCKMQVANFKICNLHFAIAC